MPQNHDAPEYIPQAEAEAKTCWTQKAVASIRHCQPSSVSTCKAWVDALLFLRVQRRSGARQVKGTNCTHAGIYMYIYI